MVREWLQFLLLVQKEYRWEQGLFQVKKVLFILILKIKLKWTGKGIVEKGIDTNTNKIIIKICEIKISNISKFL